MSTAKQRTNAEQLSTRRTDAPPLVVATTSWWTEPDFRAAQQREQSRIVNTPSRTVYRPASEE